MTKTTRNATKTINHGWLAGRLEKTVIDLI
jgi:hypothetical protein